MSTSRPQSAGLKSDTQGFIGSAVGDAGSLGIPVDTQNCMAMAPFPALTLNPVPEQQIGNHVVKMTVCLDYFLDKKSPWLLKL